MGSWVWAPEPFDMWYGPYDDAEGEIDRLQEYYTTIGLVIVEDSKLVRRRVEVAINRQEEE